MTTVTLKCSRGEISQSSALNTGNPAHSELLHWYLVISYPNSTFICVTFIFLEARPCSQRKQVVGSKDLGNEPHCPVSACFHLQALTRLCCICKSANSKGVVQSFTPGFQTLQNFVLFISTVFI